MSITDKKLWEELLKRKDLDVPKVVEQIQGNTYDRKSRTNTKPEPLESNQEKNKSWTYTPKNTYKKMREKTKTETKRTKLQFLRCTKLEP